MHVWLHARLMQRLKRSEIYLTKAYRERELKFPHRQAWDCEWQANAGAAAVILPAPESELSKSIAGLINCCSG